MISSRSELKPFFRADPKWDVFKFGLVGDNDIPINKRGSGAPPYSAQFLSRRGRAPAH